MITLYDLVFQGDRRPSPFCWRTKYALAHKGLKWTEVPMGFTEKDKIAFADSQTVPVIKDGDTPVKDSWAIAAAPRSRLSRQAAVQGRGGALLCLVRQRLVRHRGHGRLVPHDRRRSLRSRAAGGPGLYPRIARQAAGHDGLRDFPGQGAREGDAGVASSP